MAKAAKKEESTAPKAVPQKKERPWARVKVKALRGFSYQDRNGDGVAEKERFCKKGDSLEVCAWLAEKLVSVGRVEMVKGK